jgi:hypothetical protein
MALSFPVATLYPSIPGSLGCDGNAERRMRKGREGESVGSDVVACIEEAITPLLERN